MFAEAQTPDPKFLLQFILVLSLIGNVLWPLLNYLQRNKAQKRDVELVKESASQKDFDDHCKENTRMFEQMRAEASKRGKDLFDKIEETKDQLGGEITKVKESVAGLDATSKITNQLITSMDGKLNRLHERKH
jgi:hypothetical protein